MVDPGEDASSLLHEARPSTDDAVADVLRAKVRRSLLGSDVAPPTIGRFTVLHFVGAGTAGTVYAAYDPVLDRRVALKVLSAASGPVAARLEEARALAKLRHPHVVAVHEAGEVGAQIYVAMEFVDGDTLRGWLAAAERTPAGILDVLVAAGEGLAAAHAAGIAHGDFKPDNVLVADDGVRVADFGLARTIDGDATGPAGGTPGYMAPERLDGGPATAAADQFAFGVTVFEALTGQRPFAGATAAALREAMDAGEGKLARGRGVTARPLEVAARAVRLDPRERFAEMPALLAALRPPQERRGPSRRWAWPLFAVAATASVVAFQIGRDRDPCAAGAELVDAAWNADAAADVGAALREHGASFDPDYAATLVGRLDGYRDDWLGTYAQACEATRVLGTQSDTLYDLRMRCLLRRRDEFGAVVRVLRDVGGADDAAEAVTAVDALVDLTRCDGDRVETAEFSTPADADTAAAVDDVRRRISAAWAQYHVAHYQPALDLAIQIDADATVLAFTPLSADAAYLLGTTRGRIDRPEAGAAALRRARVLAGRAHLDRLAAEISVQLLRAVMFSGDPKRVVELADFVRADLARAGAPEAEVDGIVGEAQLHAGEAASALVAIASALAAESRPDRRALLLANRASAKLALDDSTGALADYEQAQAIAQAHYGRAHPAVGFFVHRVGRGELAVGDTAAALLTLERALSLREEALGLRDRAVASVLVDLAKAAEAVGQRDQARAALERALSIRREVYGDDHPSVADVERLRSQVAAEPE